jgi:hypothetical protein
MKRYTYLVHTRDPWVIDLSKNDDRLQFEQGAIRSEKEGHVYPMSVFSDLSLHDTRELIEATYPNTEIIDFVEVIEPKNPLMHETAREHS